ncbi:HesB/IscA family protein [Myxosarcina sp. GI1(2024)]
MVYISQSAAREINRIRLSHQQPDSLVRLQVKTGGCSGLFYVLKLENPEMVRISEATSRGDRLYEEWGICVIVDRQSDSYLKNLKLDYSEDLMGGGFRFQNPNASETCGCGLSFAV